MVVAHALGFEEGRRSDIGIVVTELSNNLLAHAGRGEVLICPVRADTDWLDILAVDNGQGIQDVARAFEDGVSTGGTAGQGLGAIKRLSDEVSVYSTPGGGTVVFCRFRLSASGAKTPFGVVSIPVHGEVENGDSYLVIPGAAQSFYMVVDGLGHGTWASQAAAEAVKAVSSCSRDSLGEIMTATHNALRATRGAAMSIAVVNHERSVVAYAGVGNISGLIGNGNTSRNMISQNGTLGASLPRVQEYSYPFEPGMLLLMFSDGMTSKCSLSGQPGLVNRPPGLIAGLLYREYKRGRDDATVLVASLGGSR